MQFFSDFADIREMFKGSIPKAEINTRIGVLKPGWKYL